MKKTIYGLMLLFASFIFITSCSENGLIDEFEPQVTDSLNLKSATAVTYAVSYAKYNSSNQIIERYFRNSNGVVKVNNVEVTPNSTFENYLEDAASGVQSYTWNGIYGTSGSTEKEFINVYYDGQSENSWIYPDATSKPATLDDIQLASKIVTLAYSLGTDPNYELTMNGYDENGDLSFTTNYDSDGTYDYTAVNDSAEYSTTSTSLTDNQKLALATALVCGLDDVTTTTSSLNNGCEITLKVNGITTTCDLLLDDDNANTYVFEVIENLIFDDDIDVLPLNSDKPIYINYTEELSVGTNITVYHPYNRDNLYYINGEGIRLTLQQLSIIEDCISGNNDGNWNDTYGSQTLLPRTPLCSLEYAYNGVSDNSQSRNTATIPTSLQNMFNCLGTFGMYYSIWDYYVTLYNGHQPDPELYYDKNGSPIWTPLLRIRFLPYLGTWWDVSYSCQVEDAGSLYTEAYYNGYFSYYGFYPYNNNKINITNFTDEYNLMKYSYESLYKLDELWFDLGLYMVDPYIIDVHAGVTYYTPGIGIKIRYGMKGILYDVIFAYDEHPEEFGEEFINEVLTNSGFDSIIDAYGYK